MTINFDPNMARLAQRMYCVPLDRAEVEERLVDLQEQSQAIVARADREGRDLTAQEAAEVNSLYAEFTSLGARLDTLSMGASLGRSSGRKTEPEPFNTPRGGLSRSGRRTSDTEPGRTLPSGSDFGFRNFGQFAHDVREAARPGGKPSAGLYDYQNAAASSYGSEGVGADGGYLVPPEFAREINQNMGEYALLDRTDKTTTYSNSYVQPSDETTAWGEDGIQAYWEAEAAAITQSKPLFRTQTKRLHKLAALVPVTEELLEDAPSLDAHIRRKAPEKMAFKVNHAIIQGDGIGKPLGILKSPALVTVPKESEQAADTLLFENIVNMWARLPGESQANAVWIINPDTTPKLMSMVFPGTTTAVPAYMPPSGLSAAPYGTLMGRPVIPTQACEPLGDKGDIILADLRQYRTIVKSAGVRVATSIHLWFDQDIMAFKFTFRVDGMPWLSKPITARDGVTTYSPFVALEAR